MYINLGLIGHPLSHTFSPVIHNYFIYKTGICGGYTCYNVSQENLPDLVEYFKKYDFKGINVTVPYKTEIMKYCDKLEFSSEEAGAVNTLLFDNGKITGYNTDIFGFKKMLESSNITTKGKRVLLLGAGGASRAVIPFVRESKPDRFVICNRTKSKAEEISIQYGNGAEICSFDEIVNEEYDIVINSTSIGLKGEPFLDLKIKCKEAAVDMIYRPYETSFLSCFSGVKKVNGLSMLVWQAAGSFKIWTGVNVEPEMSYFENIVYGSK